MEILVRPFTYWWSFGWLPVFGYYSEHISASFCVDICSYSYIHLLRICLLWWSVCSNVWFFNGIVWLLNEFLKFFTYSRYKSSIRDYFINIFSQFQYLNCVLFNFKGVKIFIFSFIAYTFYIIFKKYLPNSRSLKFLPIFSSTWLITLGFTFRPTMYFKVIFVLTLRVKVIIFGEHKSVQMSWYHLLKDSLTETLY